jgi:hypothetical protein
VAKERVAEPEVPGDGADGEVRTVEIGDGSGAIKIVELRPGGLKLREIGMVGHV